MVGAIVKRYDASIYTIRTAVHILPTPYSAEIAVRILLAALRPIAERNIHSEFPEGRLLLGVCLQPYLTPIQIVLNLGALPPQLGATCRI